ncbi:F-actin-uncapping protein LRRC16A-like isoform X3 [Dermatophagoides pteronyssinus]|uniref:F-actin-uncapping protein LRRC16A-like isoform X3 n=1 Tax=Dermatophagoides pteronyssinus TaxID=6956 RepID=UPI003F66497E
MIVKNIEFSCFEKFLNFFLLKMPKHRNNNDDHLMMMDHRWIKHVSNMIGPNIKLTHKAMLKLELKTDKFENRLLIFTQYRLFIFTVKGGGSSTKLEHSYNLIDINHIESRQSDRLIIGFRSIDSKHPYCFHSCDPNQEEINLIICHLVSSLKTLFPYMPFESFIKRFIVEPKQRLDNIYEYVQLMEERLRFRSHDHPCGGFSNQYACFCDYYGVPYREEVARDIDTIYAAHNHTELSILDFEHLDLKDLQPLIAALTYNGYFTKFRVSNVKIVNSSQSGSDQLCELIVNLVRRSTKLEEIYLDNTGIRADFVNKLFQAMLLNNQTSIQYIDLSNNTIEDKGLKNMTAFVAKSFHMANSMMMNNSSEDLSSASLSLLNFSTCSNPIQSQQQSNNSNNNTITSSAKLMYKGLVHLNLSHCGITSKGISELSESLYLNKSMFSTLTYLNLSDNCFKDDLSKLYNFLAQPNNIAHLDLSGTDCNLESVFGALLHGCTNNLVHLNLSRNQFSGKKSSHKDLIVPVSIKKFFSTAIFLRTLDLSHNRLPTDALKAILLGLACNESASNLRINLSSNEFRSNGAAVLELCLADIRCVSGLDLSDNGLDMDLIQVIGAIAKNKSIKYLSIGRNFNNIKAKHLPKVLDAFSTLLQDPDCSIESLLLVDSKLRAEISIILDALGSNQSLITIDISGNLMGLLGAKTLAKTLQINNHMETIYLDRNLIPTAGFFDIAYALERNYTLKYLPIPIQDLQAAMMKMPERTEIAMNKIQEFIRRNNLPQTAAVRNMRLHNLQNSHFIVDNNLFVKIDKIAIQLQNLIREKSPLYQQNRKPSLDSIDISTHSNQDKTITVDDFCMTNENYIGRIENLLNDVRNMRSLYSKVQEVYAHTTQTMNGLSSSSSINDSYGRRFSSIAISRPIEATILEFSRELKSSFEGQVVSVSELIIQCIKDEFPNVFFHSQHLEGDLRELYKNSININSTQSLIPPMEYFQVCLTEAVGTQWSIKLEQILNTIASQICNKVLIEINRCLMNTQKMIDSCDLKSRTNAINLNNNHHVHSNGNSNGPSIRSLTPSDLRSQTLIESYCSSQDSNDLLSLSKHDNDQQMMDSDSDNAIWLAWLNLATPKLGNSQKRQNVYIRKLRPQSVLDGDIIVTNEDDFTDLMINRNDQSQSNDNNNANNDSIHQTKPNLHLTKMRPRNRKIRAPTRVTIVDSKTTANKDQQIVDNNPIGSKLDEGLDNFFPSLSLMNNSSSSNVSIESKEIDQTIQQNYQLQPNKPQPQPRKILRKLGFKSQSEQQQSIDKQAMIKQNEELIFSNSPIIFGNRRVATAGSGGEHVSICSDSNDVHHTGGSRVHSPLPSASGDIQQHNELLAEMKAIQEKRSYNSTPVSNEQLTFASTLEKKSSIENIDDDKSSIISQQQQSSDDTSTTNNSTSISVAKRATIFGDLHKSPSKHSISSPTEENNEIIGSKENHIANSNNQNKSTTTSTTSSSRQRPKSMVGMLGAKFELSLMNSNSNK